MKFNEKLKSLRKNNSQKETAKKIGIQYANYNKYETANAMPDIETLTKIADYYKITIDELVGHEVPYLIDKSLMSKEQLSILNLIKELTNPECEKVEAYIYGLKSVEIEKNISKNKFFR